MLSVFSRNCVGTNPPVLFGFFAKFAPKIFFAAIASKNFRARTLVFSLGGGWIGFLGKNAVLFLHGVLSL